jgi:hypothetical protein
MGSFEFSFGLIRNDDVERTRVVVVVVVEELEIWLGRHGWRRLSEDEEVIKKRVEVGKIENEIIVCDQESRLCGCCCLLSLASCRSRAGPYTYRDFSLAGS